MHVLKIFWALVPITISKCDVQIQETFWRYSKVGVYNPVDVFLKPYADFLEDTFRNLQNNSSDQCSRQTKALWNLASNGDEQALRFFDATGKPQSGILEGGLTFLGFHSECLRSQVVVDNSLTIYGKYCLLPVNFTNSEYPENVLPRVSWALMTDDNARAGFGICIPSSCTTEDVLSAANPGITGRLKPPFSCSDDRKFSEDGVAISTLVVFILFLVLVASATAYDCIQTRIRLNSEKNVTQSTELLCVQDKDETGSTLKKCFLAFAMQRNAAKIAAVGNEKSSGSIGALHGLRLFSMVLIIFGHTYSFAQQDLFYINPREMSNVPKQIAAQIFANGTLAVDTFYFISGLLVTYVTLGAMQKKNGKIPYIYFYLHRYMRLTPLLMIVIFFCAGLLKYLGSGPNWDTSIQMYDAWCEKNWWTNLLYLQNFIDTENMCLSHSWYLATDMQFYIFTPLILVPLYKNFWLGMAVIVVFFASSTLTTGILTAIHNYPAIPYINTKVTLELMNEYYGKVYIKPYCRIGPYLIGILAGYLLVKRKEIILKKWQAALGWLAAVVLMLTVALGMSKANQGILPPTSVAAAYSALARSAWAIGIAWITLACFYGYGGFINSILSWGPLFPFSRLTYCAYLIHPVVMAVFYGSFETTVHFSQFFNIYLFVGNLVITYVLSFFLTLCFESPFIGLEKAIITKRKSNESTSFQIERPETNTVQESHSTS